MEAYETATEAAPPIERRAKLRMEIQSWPAQLQTGASSYACAILNVSQGGVMLQVAAPLTPRQPVRLVIGELGSLRAEVAWHIREKQKAGIRFIESAEAIARVFNGSLPL